jgi:hypothetical protein
MDRKSWTPRVQREKGMRERTPSYRPYPLVRVTTNGDAVMYDTAPETTMTEKDAHHRLNPEEVWLIEEIYVAPERTHTVSP